MKEFVDFIVELPEFVMDDMRALAAETGETCPRTAMGLVLSDAIESSLQENRRGFLTRIQSDGCFQPATAADALDCLGRGESVWLARCPVRKLKVPIRRSAMILMESFVKRSRKASSMDWYDSHLSVSHRLACALAACETVVEAWPESENTGITIDRSRKRLVPETATSRAAFLSRPAPGCVARPEPRAKYGDVLPQGCLTSMNDFVIPVLLAFKKLEGLGRGVEIKKIVAEIMAGRLNGYDLEQVPSSPAELRWHKTVHCLVGKWKARDLVSGHGHLAGWRLTYSGWAFLRETLAKGLPPEKVDKD